MFRSALPARPEARRIIIGGIFSAIGRGMTLPFLFIYLTDVRGLTDAMGGLVIGWIGGVSLALAPVAGALIDRFGARRVVLPCLIIEAIGVASLGLVGTPWHAFASATAIATGSAAIWAGLTTIIASLVSDEESQRVFGLQFALLNLGLGTGGLISGAIVDITRPATFQLVYGIDAVGYLIPAAVLLSLPSVGHRLAEESSATTGRKVGYVTVLRDRAFRRLVIFGLLLTICGYAQMDVGFTAFASRIAEVSPRVIAWAFAANTLVIVLAQLVVIKFLEGRSRTRVLAVVGCTFALAWTVLGLAGLVDGLSPLVVALGVIGCLAVFAVGETMLSPIMPALTNALASDDLRGRYNALISMIWGVSGVVGPVTAGPLIGSGHGGAWVILVVGGCLLVAAMALSLRTLLTPQQDGQAVSASECDPLPDTLTRT